MTEQRAIELLADGARIYIAARFSRRPECNQLAQVLKYRGALITSRWVKPDCDHVLPTGLSRQAEDHERQRFALEDVDDVRAANWMISLMEEPRSNTRGGRHIEFGLALALGHRLTIIGPRETVFHHLPEVEHFNTIDDFVASLPDTRAALSTPFAESAKSPSDSVREALELAARRFESLAASEREDIASGRPCAHIPAMICFDEWGKEARAALQSSEADNG